MIFRGWRRTHLHFCVLSAPFCTFRLTDAKQQHGKNISRDKQIVVVSDIWKTEARSSPRTSFQ
jgi:hypothetical protein